MGIEHQSMLHLKITDELPTGFDPVELQRELQAMVREKMPTWLHERIATEQCETYGELVAVMRGNVENVHMEMAEVLESLPWKYWKHTHVEHLGESVSHEHRMELLFEIADALHFLINMVIAVGGTWDDLMRVFYAKQLENRRRQNVGY